MKTQSNIVPIGSRFARPAGCHGGTGIRRAATAAILGVATSIGCSAAHEHGSGEPDEAEVVTSGAEALAGGVTFASCDATLVTKLTEAYLLLTKAFIGSGYAKTVTCMERAHTVEDNGRCGAQIVDAIASNNVVKITCADLDESVAADAEVDINGSEMRIDRDYANNGSAAAIAGTMAHELAHNLGYLHSVNDHGSRYYGNTIPEQVEACVKKGSANPWPDPTPPPLGCFADQTAYSWTNGCDNAFAGDFNGDGKDDIGVSCDGKWTIRYNLGSGQFGNQTQYTWGNGSTCQAVFAGDFNGDEKDDIGVGCTNGKWYIRYNLGNGQFGNQTQYTWGNGSTCQAVFAGDFDGDERDDIGVGCTNGKWYIRYNQGAGQFGGQIQYTWGNGSTCQNAFASDFDGDGWDDLGVECTNGSWYIRYNTGNYQFGEQTRYNWGNSCHAVVAGDFDGSGFADLGVDCKGKAWYVRYNVGE